MVSTLRGSKPGSTCSSATKLRSSRLAAISRIIDTATWQITISPRILLRRKLPAAPRPDSRRITFRSGFEASSEGINPKTTAVSIEIANVNASVSQSICTSPARGRLSWLIRLASPIADCASNSPSAPLESASTELSASNWRIKSARPAPNAARTANSFRRPVARAINRLATFAHAINNTAPMAAHKTSNAGFTFSTRTPRNGLPTRRASGSESTRPLFCRRN